MIDINSLLAQELGLIQNKAGNGNYTIPLPIGNTRFKYTFDESTNKKCFEELNKIYRMPAFDNI